MASSMRKVEAYTLMEIAIAMLLAAMCMSICYTAYGLIGDYFRAFQRKNSTVEEVLSLQRTMSDDVLKAKCIIRTAKGISLNQDSLNIMYQFEPEYILRTAVGLHTDSFQVKPVDSHFLFEGIEAIEPDTVDQISFVLSVDKQLDVPVRIQKFYSAQDLFK